MVINPIKVIGKGVVILGMAALFLMSIIGAMSLDLLLLYVISNRSSRDNVFVTIYLWHMLLSSRDSLYQDVGLMVLCSPFISAITVGLSFAVGAPEFGVLLMAGWVGAFTVVLAGTTIYGLGDALEAVVEWMVDGLSFGVSAASERVTHILSEGSTLGRSNEHAATSHRHVHPQGKHAHADGDKPHEHSPEDWRRESHHRSPVYGHNSPPNYPSAGNDDGLPKYDEVFTEDHQIFGKTS
jgi:hypothetical protein